MAPSLPESATAAWRFDLPARPHPSPPPIGLPPRPPRAAVAPSRTLRDALASEIARSPGLTLAALARAVGASPNAVAYHARVLAERGAIVLARNPGPRAHYHAYAAENAPPRAARSAALALEPRVARAIRDALVCEPALVGPVALAEKLGVPAPVVRYHLDRLEEAGVVECVRARGRVAYRLAGSFAS